MKIHHLLAALLAFAVLTLWVGERWAISGVEIGAYVVTCAVIVIKRGSMPVGVMLLAPALMCAWATVQWCAHWTVVPSATVDSVLYWLAASCFVLLGSQVERNAFLKTSLVIGTVVCIAGTIQLFTSHGNVFWLFPSGFDRRVIGPFVSPNNYAAFVELLMPIALSRRKLPYLLIAAALAASVVASGSRAGAVLVLAEVVAIPVLQRWNRNALLSLAFLISALSLIAGQQFLASRFTQKDDALAVRREFLESTLAMFRAEPAHGFGLGAWPSAYPKYAIIDTGETANHSHNEWAQWAAEGGIPALAFMLGLLLWSVKPATRSIWGIGIFAVFAHSLVDYPFLRLGLAAWVFAYLGALSSSTRFRRHVSAAVFAPVLLFGIWQAGKLAYADALYRRATPSSVEKAVALAPDQATYHFTLAQLDSAHAAAHLERALVGYTDYTEARIGLALERESSGDSAGSERLLLEAAQNDHQFAPAWALANFYFRKGDPDQFWNWTQRSAAMSYGDRRALFDLCLLVSPDAHQLYQKVVAPYPTMALPFLKYLLVRNRVHDAAEIAVRIARDWSPASRDMLLDYIDAAIGAGDIESAWKVQKQLTKVPGLLANGDFAKPPTNRGFDWRTPPTDGISLARTEDSGSVLAVEFSGREPESCDLLSHALALENGATYVMRFDYRTEDLPAETGISWQLRNKLELNLAASSAWRTEEWRFHATDLEVLKLAYRRASGSTRAEGRLFLRNARIEPAPYRLSADGR